MTRPLLSPRSSARSTSVTVRLPHIATAAMKDDAEIVVECAVSPFVPARLEGPIERWAPAEGGDVDILSATVDGQPVRLTPDERARAEQAARREASHREKEEWSAEDERRWEVARGASWI